MLAGVLDDEDDDGGGVPMTLVVSSIDIKKRSNY